MCQRPLARCTPLAASKLSLMLSVDRERERETASHAMQVEGFIGAGVDPRAVDAQQRGGAHFAASKGELPILQALHSQGVDLDSEDATGRAAVHYAALGNHESCVKFLADRSCWLDAADGDDCTPLHCAAQHGATETAVRLIKAGAKPALRNSAGLSPAGAPPQPPPVSTGEPTQLCNTGSPGAGAVDQRPLLLCLQGWRCVPVTRALSRHCSAPEIYPTRR